MHVPTAFEAISHAPRESAMQPKAHVLSSGAHAQMHPKKASQAPANLLGSVPETTCISAVQWVFWQATQAGVSGVPPAMPGQDAVSPPIPPDEVAASALGVAPSAAGVAPASVPAVDGLEVEAHPSATSEVNTIARADAAWSANADWAAKIKRMNGTLATLKAGVNRATFRRSRRQSGSPC